MMGLAACVGNQTDVATLAVVAAEPEEAVRATLGRCVLLGYMAHDTRAEPSVYRFLHDKIADATYNSIESSEQKMVHTVMGERLLAQLTESAASEIKTTDLLRVLFQLHRGHAPDRQRPASVGAGAPARVGRAQGPCALFRGAVGS